MKQLTIDRDRWAKTARRIASERDDLRSEVLDWKCHYERMEARFDKLLDRGGGIWVTAEDYRKYLATVSREPEGSK